MVSSSSFNVVEGFKNVRAKYCFYLDLQDRGLANSLRNRIQDIGLREELFLTECVTHVIGDVAAASRRVETCQARSIPRRTRADAMLERVWAGNQAQLQPKPPPPHYKILSVREAILLLDRIYDNYFRVAKKKVNTHFKAFTKHFIKVEILDRLCRPLFQEFDEWPDISLEPTVTSNPEKGKKNMTRKSRLRIKEIKDRDEKETKGGYCEICNAEYANAAIHQKSLHHLSFVRDTKNFLSLDTLISAGTDVSTFLDKVAPINGERRSLRNMCNGDLDRSHSSTKRCTRSQTPESPINGIRSPRQTNGGLEDDRRRNTRCSKRSSDRRPSEERQYYKVVGVSTKLRSSGGFITKRKDSSPTNCNGGTKPLVVKFKKVRRSELSVLSDEAEQFMFPKRASSASSMSSEEDDEQEAVLMKSPLRPPPPVINERQRLARPLALKEESSEEDSWPEIKKRKKKRVSMSFRRGRPPKCVPTPEMPMEVETPNECEAKVPEEVPPVNVEPVEKCMKWEDGRLKYTPAVEQLEFAFESVPQSEPWFETFKRQDEDKVVTKNIPNYFALYSKSPKLPYEIGHLPPLKPNCCSLSDLIKREEKPGPSRSYGTRGNKKQKLRKRTIAEIISLEAHPRKSPREHASTLAILGSAGLMHRKRNTDDTKSTASEDTISETLSTTKMEPSISETQHESERFKKFFSEVFEDAAEYEVPEEDMEGDVAVLASNNAPNVLNLVSECEGCDMIRDEIASSRLTQKGKGCKYKKKNRTGWPSKKRVSKKDGSRTGSMDLDMKIETSFDRSSEEPPDNVGESSQDESMSEAEEPSLSSVSTVIAMNKSLDDESLKSETEDQYKKDDKSSISSDDRPLRLDVKVLVQEENKKNEAKAEKEIVENKILAQSSTSESDSKEKSPICLKTRSAIQNLGNWLQPVVRVARVDPNTARQLRSAGRTRTNRFR